MKHVFSYRSAKFLVTEVEVVYEIQLLDVEITG